MSDFDLRSMLDRNPSDSHVYDEIALHVNSEGRQVVAKALLAIRNAFERGEINEVEKNQLKQQLLCGEGFAPHLTALLEVDASMILREAVRSRFLDRTHGICINCRGLYGEPYHFSPGSTGKSWF